MAPRLTVLNHPVVYEPACAVGAMHLADLPRLRPDEKSKPVEVRRVVLAGAS